MEDRGNPMPIWKWILVVLWLLFWGFTIAFIGTCIGENELNAAITGGLIFSLFAVIAVIVLWRILGIGNKVERQNLEV